jgi:formylglycine-generating enzyme required for sulfatase activity
LPETAAGILSLLLAACVWGIAVRHGVSTFGLLCLLTALLGSPVLAAGKRVALVIGNSAYVHTPKLANPRNDAEDMAAALKALGFIVIEGRDLDKPRMDRTVQQFAEALTGAEVGLFFYAGHGLQVNGINYLVPTDAKLPTEHALDFEMVRLDLVQRVMERATQTNVIFLDACRDNPLGRNLTRAMGTRSAAIGKGLANVEAGIGTLISYATHPGAVAIDGDGRNSPYTAALKKRIGTPDEDLFAVLLGVRNDVLAATGGRQVPWDQHALRARLYLGPSAPIPPPVPSTADVEATRRANEAEIARRVEEERNRLTKEFEAERKRLARATPAGSGTPPTPVPKASPSSSSASAGDPALSVMPGSGQSFRDRLADGRDCAHCPEMVVAPAGSFMMGSAETEAGRNPDEGPLRRVTFARPFAIAKFEVTRGEFASFVRDTAYKTGGGCYAWTGSEWKDHSWASPGIDQNDRHPAVCVSWEEAKAYTYRLSQVTGRSYRLLTEAEWEFAARAHASTPYSTGDTIRSDQARFGGGLSGTVEVGTFKPNLWGLHDVHGNASEWVEDCHRDVYTNAPLDGSAMIAGDCSRRVVRGGSWYAIGPDELRSAKRGRYPQGWRHFHVGFRVARTIGQQ